jgi:hypothetical protein
MRTPIMNQLQALAINEGKRWKKKLFSEQQRTQLEKFPLAACGHLGPGTNFSGYRPDNRTSSH